MEHRPEPLKRGMNKSNMTIVILIILAIIVLIAGYFLLISSQSYKKWRDARFIKKGGVIDYKRPQGFQSIEAENSFYKTEFFALLEYIASNNKPDKRFVEETLGVKLGLATKQAWSGFNVYEGVSSRFYDSIDYAVFYEPEAQAQGGSASLHIGLTKEFQNPGHLKVSDILEKYGSNVQYYTPATSNRKFGNFSYYSHALNSGGRLNFAFRVPEGKKIDLTQMAIEVVIID